MYKVMKSFVCTGCMNPLTSTECTSVQGGPRKVKPTTILLVTFECVGKIQ